MALTYLLSAILAGLTVALIGLWSGVSMAQALVHYVVAGNLMMISLLMLARPWMSRRLD